MRENSAIPTQSTSPDAAPANVPQCPACQAGDIDFSAISLPAGAEAGDDAWYQFNYECRVFRGRERVVLNGAAEVVAEVRTTGVQYPDGSIDTGEDAPTIDISVTTEELTGSEAIELAAALVDAAAELLGWAGR